MTSKWSNLKIVLGYWNENSDSCFRFNNTKQFSDWIILVPFYSSHRIVKNCYTFMLWKFKESMQKSIFPQKFKKVCVLQRRACRNSKFQTQLYRNYNDSEHAIKTKNAQFFMIFSNINFFSYLTWHMEVVIYRKNDF